MEISKYMTSNVTLSNLVQIFFALAGEPRLRILQFLHAKAIQCNNPETCDISERCCDVTELATTLEMAISTVSYHLRELRLAGLIQMQRRGKNVYCSIDKVTIDQLVQFFGPLNQDNSTDT